MRSFPHLSGRAETLARQFEIKPRAAEWLAAVIVFSGGFLRSQYCAYNECSRTTARRFVEGLVRRKIGLEYETSWGRACRITRQRLDRALDAHDSRYYREHGPTLMHRRFLSLDYVLDHPELPWLPTEAEKLSCFDALGVPRDELQSRTYSGIGAALQYFPDRHPIAVDPSARSAVFIYVDAAEVTPTGLRTWRRAHDAL